MQDLKKGNTSIDEHARRELGITRDEYALCDYIHYRAADPKQRVRGYCCDKKEDIADFIGISRAGVYKMIDRMIEQDLIDADPTTGYFCSTSEWIRIVNEGKAKRKQSGQNATEPRVNKVDTVLEDSVNKVDTKRPKSVNLVTVNKEYDNKSDLKKSESEKQNTPSPRRQEFDSLVDALKEKQEGSAGPDFPPGGHVWVNDGEAGDYIKQLGPEPVWRYGPMPTPCAPPISISISESAAADTPTELEAAMRRFYAERPDEYNSGILENSGGKNYTPAQRTDILRDFCAHRIENGRGRDSFARQNAALQKWFRNEKYATWKNKPAQPVDAGRKIKEYGS